MVEIEWSVMCVTMAEVTAWEQTCHLSEMPFLSLSPTWVTYSSIYKRLIKLWNILSSRQQRRIDVEEWFRRLNCETKVLGFFFNFTGWWTTIFIIIIWSTSPMAWRRCNTHGRPAVSYIAVNIFSINTHGRKRRNCFPAAAEAFLRQAKFKPSNEQRLDVYYLKPLYRQPGKFCLREKRGFLSDFNKIQSTFHSEYDCTIYEFRDAFLQIEIGVFIAF